MSQSVFTIKHGSVLINAKCQCSFWMKQTLPDCQSMVQYWHIVDVQQGCFL